ncbi:hypothetical protein HDV03_002818 [Kappamyces sp. JEL0829]|nr:hypothetical protein HDV03_002818 [Kappamyces sp. JEL0829]
MKINSTLLLSVAAAACPAGFIPANALACDITTGILYNKGDCTPASSTTNYYVTDFPNSPCQVLVSAAATSGCATRVVVFPSGICNPAKKAFFSKGSCIPNLSDGYIPGACS